MPQRTSARRFSNLTLACCLVSGLSVPLAAQTTPSTGTPQTTTKPAEPATSPAAAPPAAAAPATTTPATTLPVAPGSAPTTTAPAASAPATAAPADMAKPSADASTAEEVNLAPRPALIIKGESSWDDGYKALMKVFKDLGDESRRLGLATIGKPQSVFVHTDDLGFKFEAMLILETAPAATVKPQGKASFGTAPSGRAFIFKHTGAYDDIDSAYEAITAWLDEKGLTAKGAFVEEYMTAAMESDDPALELKIYVFVE